MKAGAKSVLEGYLLVEFSGNRAERFLHLCVNRDILLWNVTSREDGSFSCNMRMCDFKQLRPLCRKTRTRVRIKKRYGAPGYLKRYRNRIMFFMAFAAMLCGVGICSTYVWNIEIIGNSYISDENLIRFLKANGVGLGTKLRQVDTDSLELTLRSSYAQIIWASTYVDGTSLVIHIKEQIKTEDLYDEASDGASDLVAAKNATVASIVTRRGTPCVVAGNEVESGDLLVSGKSEILDDNGEVQQTLYQRADADVIGYVNYFYSETIPIKSLISIDTSESKSTYFIRFLDKNLNFGDSSIPYEEYYTLESYTQAKLSDSFYLPIYWGKKEYVKRTPAYYMLAKEAAKEIAKKDFTNFLTELEENGVSIIDKNVMIKEIGDCYEVNGQVYATEPIMASRLIETPPDMEEQVTDEPE